MSRLWVLVVLAISSVMGTGTTVAQHAGTARVPVTDRAIAAVMLDHLPADTTRRDGRDQRPAAWARGTRIAELWYPGTGNAAYNLVDAAVKPRGAISCRRPYETCHWLVRHRVLMAWAQYVPEEDPGYVTVRSRNAGSLVEVTYSGVDMTRDPRTMALPFPLSRLVALATDQRLRSDATPATVRAGRGVQHWHEPGTG